MGDPNRYEMSHSRRGVAVVINNGEFSRTSGMSNRRGYEEDGKNVKETFEMLRFEVELKTNVSAAEMLEIIKKVSKEDHSDVDCFACVIMTHGKQDVVYGTDGPVDLEDIFQPFKSSKSSLLGKPKLFFIQACRGDKLDDGASLAFGVAGDGPDDNVSQRIPTEADFLVAYSSVSGFYCFRNSDKGSWFIQALCSVLKEHFRDLDLMTMMTRVNRKVAYEFESKNKDPKLTKKKQVPCITSMLTKDLFFSVNDAMET